MLASARAHIKLAPRFLEQLAHLGHAFFGFLRRDEILGGLVLLRRKFPHLLADLHRAEFGAAHAAEMGGLGALGGEGLVVVLLRRVGVERQVELVAPAEFEARFR